MTSIELNKYSDQITRLEKANRATEAQSAKLSPHHPHAHPVHVMYGGAHLFSENTFSKICQMAQDAMKFAATDGKSLRALVGADWTDDFAGNLFTRVTKKLADEALEDYRIDFEDGYGVRPDEEEDAHAKSTAATLVTLARGLKTPRHVGFRIKPLSIVAMRRSLRTLAIFIKELAAVGVKDSGLKHLVVTLPKVTNAEQVATLVDILEGYEDEHRLGPGFFGVELLVESPEAFLSIDGTLPLPGFIAAARGRCKSLHFGIYDFTSSLGIGSAGQAIDHLACDFARMWMQVAAGLAPGLGISDGIINRLPLVPKERSKSAIAAFQDTWRYNYTQMTRSLTLGYYQGWDLHPSQLPVRHVANHVFVLRELDQAVSRLKMFTDKASKASHVGGVFDDRASVLGLINFFERAVSSGVLTASEVTNLGVDLDAVRRTI